MSRRVAFFLALLPQVALLGFLIAREEMKLRSAPSVDLRVVTPTDEEDPWFGTPRLEVARVARSASLDARDKSPVMGTRVYVALAPDAGGGHHAAGWSRRYPADAPFLAGRVVALQGDWFWLDYDIDAMPAVLVDDVVTVRLSPTGKAAFEGRAIR